MKPAPFKYFRASSLDEALTALVEYGDDAKVLAGGQSLVPLLNLRLARPGVLVDINGLDELTGIERVDGALRLGALTRLAETQRSPEVAEHAPLVMQFTGHVGHVAIRSRGTVGGSLAHADPAAEWPAALLALDGEVVAHSPRGSRTIPAGELFVTTLTTALADDEILTEVRVPVSDGRGTAFVEVARRHGDFALVGVAASVRTDADGVCESAALALSGVADVPVRAPEAEDYVVGRRLADESVRRQAARLLSASLSPGDDIHASAEYRREVGGTLAARALRAASEQATGSRRER